MRSMCTIGAALAGLLLLSGCGDIAFQTRYVPRASQLSWNEDHKQLPWRPPAVKAEDHMVRSGKGHIPQYPHMQDYDVTDGVYGYHFAGDGSDADSGPLEPLQLDN